MQGLFKKVLIANQVGAMWGRNPSASCCPGFGRNGLARGGGLTLQLYFDFSAYSDMAIGMGWMLGFHFPENFRYPLFFRVGHGFLATLAYIPVHLVPGLRIYTAGRKPEGCGQASAEYADCLGMIKGEGQGMLLMDKELAARTFTLPAN